MSLREMIDYLVECLERMDNKPVPPAEQDYHEQTLLDKMKDEEKQDE
jgi:methionyl-tRNA formyltransferase